MIKKIIDLEWIIKKYLTFFEQFGISEEEIRNNYSMWSKNRPALPKDFIWFIFQELLVKTAKESKTEIDLYHSQNIIYSEMLWFRRKIEKVKANEVLQLSLATLVRKTVAEINFQLNVSIVSGHCCEYCDLLDENIFSPEDVLKNQYLGSKECTNPKGCNCTYAFSGKRDGFGNLLPK